MNNYRDNPAAHVFADTEAALARMRRTAKAAGCRVVSARQIGPDVLPASDILPRAVLLIELEKEAVTDEAISLLDWTRHEA